MSRPVALITGASSGIGAAFARQLAQGGYDLVLVARRRERLEALARELQQADANLRADVIVQDLRAPNAAATIGIEVARLDRPIHLLVNNAGFGWNGRFVEGDADVAAGQIAVNVGAVVALTRAFVPAMVARGRGAVINVASTAAFQPVPYMAVYGATKAFVLSFSEAMHEELRTSGVRVVAFCPGPTATEFFGDGEIRVTGPLRDADAAVRTALAALERNAAVTIDGPANAFVAVSVRFLPRPFVRRVAALLMRPRARALRRV